MNIIIKFTVQESHKNVGLHVHDTTKPHDVYFKNEHF